MRCDELFIEPVMRGTAHRVRTSVPLSPPVDMTCAALPSAMPRNQKFQYSMPAHLLCSAPPSLFPLLSSTYPPPPLPPCIFSSPPLTAHPRRFLFPSLSISGATLPDRPAFIPNLVSDHLSVASPDVKGLVRLQIAGLFPSARVPAPHLLSTSCPLSLSISSRDLFHALNHSRKRCVTTSCKITLITSWSPGTYPSLPLHSFPFTDGLP